MSGTDFTHPDVQAAWDHMRTNDPDAGEGAIAGQWDDYARADALDDDAARAISLLELAEIYGAAA